MSHLLIILFTLSLTAAFGAALASFLFYLKHKTQILKHCVAYHLILIFYILISLSRQYIWNIAPADNAVFRVMIELMFFLWFFLMFIYFPRFIYSLAGYSLRRWTYFSFLLIALTPVFLSLVSFFLTQDSLSLARLLNFYTVYILNTLLGLMILYLLIFLMIKYKGISQPVLKKAVKGIIVLTFLFLPGIIYDLLLRGKFLPSFFIDGSFFCAIFIFAWNTLSLIFFYPVLFRKNQTLFSERPGNSICFSLPLFLDKT